MMTYHINYDYHLKPDIPPQPSYQLHSGSMISIIKDDGIEINDSSDQFVEQDQKVFVTFTLTNTKRYVFDYIEIYDSDYNDIEYQIKAINEASTQYTVSFIATDKPIYVNIHSMVKKYFIYVDGNIAGGKITTDKAYEFCDEVVNVIAIPDPGQRVLTLTRYGKQVGTMTLSNSNPSFIMPEEDV